MRVRADPAGCENPERDEAGPGLEGYPDWARARLGRGPDWVEGEVVTQEVDAGLGEARWHYTRYMINGIDMDEKTIEPV